MHRDLKPGNVVMTGSKGSETVKLLDFGLAKLPEAAAAAGAYGGEIADHRRRYSRHLPVHGAGGKEELLLESKEDKNAEDWSRDGKYLIYNTGTSRYEIWSIDPTETPVKPVPVLASGFSQSQGRLSSDGRWVAYTSNESGKSEVYVQNFPPAGGKWQISTASGQEPQWRSDGKELFYVQDGKSVMSVAINPLTNKGRNRLVIAQDGQRFLVMDRADLSTRDPFTLVLNWAPGRKK